MAVKAAASDVCAVTGYACCNAVFAGTFQNFVIHTVHGSDTGAFAALECKRCILIFYAAEVRLCLQSTCHILAQVDAEAGQSVRVGAGEVRVGDDGGQRGGVALRHALRHRQAFHKGKLFLIA